MKIVHVMADGKVINDITGHVIKPVDNSEIYKILVELNKKGKGVNEHAEENS